MFEEPDSKWVRVPERSNKKNSNYRGNYRGDGGASHPRGARREGPRSREQEGRSRVSSGQEKQYHDRSGSREKDREEGEIIATGEASMKLASQQFQQELSNTQARGAEAISDPVDTEKGLQALKVLVEEKSDKVDDEYVMEMDEIKAVFLEHSIDMDEAGDLDDAAEEEMEEAGMVKEDVASLVETTVEVETERGRGTEELAKQQRPRKRFFKPTGNAVGSNKMRIANALVKRAAAKASTRQGDGRKKQESKGASNLKSGNFKA